MGAVSEGAPFNNAQFDNIRRYRTTCKVRIDSHRFSDPIWISDDVRGIQVSKSIKGTGQANVQIVPNRNWLNFIAPNDLINIYFNIGDGEGWTRTFFGFVDRIEEDVSVSPDGTPNTVYHLLCTDFYKAFDRTQIYFNPHLAGRTDLDGAFFGTPNIGGLALQTAGVRVFGAPSDIVVNLILLLLGFGTQFTLPDSYQPRLASKLRADRAAFVTERLTLSDFAREAIATEGFDALLQELRREAEGTARNVANAGETQEERIQALTESAGLQPQEVAAASGAAEAGDEEALTRFFLDRALQREITLQDPTRASDDDRGALTILNSTLTGAPPSLLDVIDPITFVERRAMDGFHAGASVWQRQGPLASIIRALSHELVNELVFDLRPVTAPLEGGADNDGNTLIALPYSRAADEIDGNISDIEGEQNGVKYIPAVVMREYPFSTIEGLALSSQDILGGAQTAGGPDNVFFLWFGEIFQDRVNEPGRHIVSIPNINVADRRDGRSDVEGIKHLDVAVISEQEIMKSTLGRSDQDHYNLMEFYSDALLGTDQRFYMHDLLPIITPIHVMRNGLRVRSLTTRFARFSVSTASLPRPQPPQEAQEEAQEAEEEAPPAPTSTELVAPTSQAENPNVRFRNRGFARHGYREKTGIGPNGAWVMHNGVDIPGPTGTTIRAIADGEVIGSCPTGVFGAYGNIVIIKHPQFTSPDGKPILSAYAHLDSIAVGPGAGISSGTRRDKRRFCTRDIAGGRASPVAVRKGDVIGTMGRSGVRRSGPHLHFEIDTHFPPRNDTLTPRLHFSTPPSDFAATVLVQGGTRQADQSITGGTVLTSAAGLSDAERRSLTRASFWDGLPRTGTQRAANWGGPVPSGEANRPDTPAGSRSLDPVQFYSDNGLDLEDLINSTTPPPANVDTEVEEDEDDRGVPSEDEPEDTNVGPDEAGATPDVRPASASSRGVVVDSALVRQQIVRWALLNDHWYQHNLEYLSGRIEMRGAPEIRVGYRLDLYERRLSCYVETVSHSWQFPNKMTTTLGVTRGQPNNPYPMYVLPPIDVYEPTSRQRKTETSRLAQFFIVPDPIAVRRGIAFRRSRDEAQIVQDNALGVIPSDESINYVDSEEQISRYDEAIILPGNAMMQTTAETEQLLNDAEALEEVDAFLAREAAAERVAASSEDASADTLADRATEAGTTGRVDDAPLSSLPGGDS